MTNTILGLCEIPATANSTGRWNDYRSWKTRTRSTARSAYCKQLRWSSASRLSEPYLGHKTCSTSTSNAATRRDSWGQCRSFLSFLLTFDWHVSLSLEAPADSSCRRWANVPRCTWICSLWFLSLHTIVGTTVIDKLVPPGPKPPRQYIIEQYPQLPQKPQDVIIERWLPLPPRQRRILYERLPPNTRPTGGRPIIVQYGPPHVRIQREVITTPGSSLPYQQTTGQTDINHMLSQLGVHHSMSSSSVIIFSIMIFNSMMCEILSVISVFHAWLQSICGTATKLWSG